MTIQERHAEIIAEFSEMDDWAERYEFIVDLGKELPPFPDEYRIPEYKVSGCVSQVWLRAEYKDGKIEFFADSDSLFVRGEIALLREAYSGFSPADILQAGSEFLRTIGLSDNLSPTRANGLGSMVNLIREYATKYQES